ncbi:hypothetical protein N7490_002025 [Penicillium lividum]|nr:hypothetical protein N7490_002025 [Penicillium lividum]
MEKPFDFLEVEGIPNFRGFGGYPCSIKGYEETRKGLLYRSAHPGGMTEKGLGDLQAMGIKYIVDLTCYGEKTLPWNIPLKTLQKRGLHRLHMPIEKESFSVERLLLKYNTYEEEGPEAVSRAYVDLLENGSETIRKLLLFLKANPNTATLVHCSLGKDRTGIVFILLLLLMGVPDSFIAKEYSLSTKGLKSTVGTIENFLREKTNNDHHCGERALQITTTQ